METRDRACTGRRVSGPTPARSPASCRANGLAGNRSLKGRERTAQPESLGNLARDRNEGAHSAAGLGLGRGPASSGLDSRPVHGRGMKSQASRRRRADPSAHRTSGQLFSGPRNRRNDLARGPVRTGPVDRAGHGTKGRAKAGTKRVAAGQANRRVQRRRSAAPRSLEVFQNPASKASPAAQDLAAQGLAAQDLAARGLAAPNPAASRNPAIKADRLAPGAPDRGRPANGRAGKNAGRGLLCIFHCPVPPVGARGAIY